MANYQRTIKWGVEWLLLLLRRNIKSIPLICFHGIAFGLFVQWATSESFFGSYFIIRLIIFIELTGVAIFLIWIAYVLIISRLFIFKWSKEMMLLKDSLSYLPLTISLFIIISLSLCGISIQSHVFIVLGGCGTVFLKTLYFYRGKANESERLDIVAFNNKKAIIDNLYGLKADPTIANLYNDHASKIRKYFVQGEMRNALNMRRIKSGTINTKAVVLNGKLRYSIGWEPVDSHHVSGNLKIHLISDNSQRIILNKDAKNLLIGWNEYEVDVEPKNQYKLKFEHDIINDDLFFCFSERKAPKVIKKKKKNIVVIILDMITPETLGIYRDSPNDDYISRFFKKGLVFNNAYAQGEWTLPNFACMATSLYQSAHGVHDPDLYGQRLSDDHKLLAEILQENSYNTFAHVSHNRISPGYGHARGYDRFNYNLLGNGSPNNHWGVTLSSLRFLQEHQDENNFMFIHYYDVHRPYFPSPNNISTTDESLFNKRFSTHREEWQHGDSGLQFKKELYCQKFIEVDHGLSQLLNYLEKKIDTDTTVLFFSDHGTLLYNDELNKQMLHDQNRGRWLPDCMIKVPFMIRGPGIENDICNNLIESNLSLLPTILDLADIKVPMNIDGSSVLTQSSTENRGKDYIISEAIFKERYELLLKSQEYLFQYSAIRDRKTTALLRDIKPKLYFLNPKGNPIVDTDIPQIKKEVTARLSKYNFPKIEI